MTTRTPLELARNVLLHLGKMDATGTPDAADSTYIMARYEDMHAELLDEGIGYWPVDLIPAVIFEPLTHYVGLSVSKAFGGREMSIAEMEDGLAQCKRRIRRHAHKRSAELPVERELF